MSPFMRNAACHPPKREWIQDFWISEGRERNDTLTGSRRLCRRFDRVTGLAWTGPVLTNRFGGAIARDCSGAMSRGNRERLHVDKSSYPQACISFSGGSDCTRLPSPCRARFRRINHHGGLMDRIKNRASGETLPAPGERAVQSEFTRTERLNDGPFPPRTQQVRQGRSPA